MQDSRDERLYSGKHAASDPPADRRAGWESKWARADFAPRWRIRSIPLEVRQVVEQAWFPAGAFVLDIGCGSGEIAAWLAGQGYEVVGIDFSRAAIARAQAEHREVRRLTFEEVDICQGAPQGAPFGALLDRGCLQGVPLEAKPDYVRNVAAAAKPGARFLLLHRILPDTTREVTVRSLEALCQGAFDVVRVADTELACDPATSQVMRGVVFWMTRR
jgi:2-polyprenyl-3-methyl-5-hydroxy-6-metoxy-1,4-benzoquinol methylase